MAPVICPFCEKSVESPTEDHIFPAYLGGRATILACAHCNNSFGHTFEAQTAANLTPLMISIQAWGVPLRQPPVTWKRAVKIDARDYNLEIANGKLLPSLSRGVDVTQDQAGVIQSGVFRDQESFDQFLRHLRRKFPDALFESEFRASDSTRPLVVDQIIAIDPSLRRQALKMSLAIAAKFGDPTIIDPQLKKQLFVACDHLDHHWDNPTIVATWLDYPTLDALMPPLCHSVYLEQNDRVSYAIVKFFGELQVYCLLGRAKLKREASATLAILDPVSGTEEFKPSSVLDLVAPPDYFPLEEMQEGFAYKLNRIAEAVKARGATTAVDFRVTDMRFTKPK